MNELTTIPTQSPFSDASSFEHIQRVAKIFATSDLVPNTFKNKIGNCVIALEMSWRMQASPLMVMQNMYVIHGKPSWASTFLIACINKSGLFSPIRYESNDDDGGKVRAIATDLQTNQLCYGSWVSINMAKNEGWLSKKGSKWQTMPELMLRYRAAAFFQRQFCPEISMGFHTTEEIRDISSSQNENGNTEIESFYPSIIERLKNQELTTEELKELEQEIKELPRQDIKIYVELGNAKKRLGL